MDGGFQGVTTLVGEGTQVERRISEADWKILRQLEPVALERFCQRVLTELVTLASDTSSGSHERYQSVYSMIDERNRQMAAAFDGLRRSAALLQLARMKSLGLISDEEFARFSTETQQAMALITGDGQ